MLAHSSPSTPPEGSIYLGIMSGTSLDGVDIAALHLSPQGHRFLCAENYALSPTLTTHLLELTQPGTNEIEKLGAVDCELGQVFAHCINRFLTTHQLRAQDITAIGSHGQTIRHRPEQGFSLQIGDPNVIAEQTGITTVADFRRRDIACGGQGAPLVPAFHGMCFRSPQVNRIILNLGGMANITLLPCDMQQAVIGYDTGPANILLDAWIQHTCNLPYDKSGDWAASGQPDDTLLSKLLATPFFAQPPPKSTGREQFHLGWLQAHLNSLSHPIKPEDVQATLLSLTCQSIVSALQQEKFQHFELYLCGGGAHNDALVTKLKQKLPDIPVCTTDRLGLHPDWVEACAFAWLAKQTLEGKPGNLPSVTGASKERILGGIYPA